MKFKNNLFKLTAIFVFIFGLLLRIYNIKSNPPGLYLDEAAQGYNSFSLLKTRNDEFGMKYPILLRSFNDFKNPLYTYLTIPIIKIYGLNVFSTRLLSVISGTLTIVFTYLLLNKLYKVKGRRHLSIVTSLLLVISPWHILLSRGAFEVSLSLFLLIAGIYYFYLGLEKPSFLIVSSLLLSLCFTSYHAQRFIVPLLLVFLFIRNKKILLQKKTIKYFKASLLVGTTLLSPIIIISLTPGFIARAKGLSLFSKFGFFGSIREILSLYFSYLSPRYMFTLGDYDQKMLIPELSTFFLWQFPFYLYGLYQLVKSKKSEFKSTVLFLFALTPIPASITRDPYSTIRSLPLLIPQIIIISYGIFNFVNFIKRKMKSSKLFLNGFFVIISLSLILFSILKLYSSLYLLYPYYKAKYWNFGYEELSDYLSTNPNEKIVIDNTRITEPYIELLFFLSYDPSKYQKHNNEVDKVNYYNKLERLNDKNLDNISIKPIEWETDLKNANYLIGDNLSISYEQIDEHDLNLIKEITYPNGEIAFRVVKINH